MFFFLGFQSRKQNFFIKIRSEILLRMCQRTFEVVIYAGKLLGTICVCMYVPTKLPLILN